jgi:DNA-directed RNA polymerase subunit RPC12/RpoP
VISFQCPACKKVLKVTDASAGKKGACPSCGQRLKVPPPVQNRNKTVLGRPLKGRDTSLPEPPSPHPSSGAPVIPRGKIAVGCPGCGRSVLLPPNELTWTIECSQCGTRFIPAGTPAPPQPPIDPQDDSDNDAYPAGSRQAAFGTASAGYPRPEYHGEVDDVTRYVATQKHSALGIASFIIAMFVGGLDIILAFFIATNLAEAAPRHPDNGHDLAVARNLIAGGLSMYCFNCMSIPLCLVGAGLGLVGLIAHRGQNHVFTWIGLLGNGAVIVCVVGLYLYVTTVWR